MKIIVSINGIDNIGKTTQIDMLKSQNESIVYVGGNISKYNYVFRKSQMSYLNGSFIDSSHKEFCETIISSIYYSYIEILELKYSIIVLIKD